MPAAERVDPRGVVAEQPGGDRQAVAGIADGEVGDGVGRGVAAIRPDGEEVGIRTTAQRVVAQPPLKVVRTCTAIQDVVAVVAIQEIVAVAAIQDVVACAAVERVVSRQAVQGVVAGETIDPVVTGGAGQ